MFAQLLSRIPHDYFLVKLFPKLTFLEIIEKCVGSRCQDNSVVYMLTSSLALTEREFVYYLLHALDSEFVLFTFFNPASVFVG